MKRKIGLYIALLAIIVGGAPYFAGYLVETKFQDVVSIVSEFEPITVTILEYQRGWRHSYAKTQVTFKGKYLQKLVNALEKNEADKLNHGLNIILEHDIRHGPFVQLKDANYKDWLFGLASIHSKLFLTEKARQVLTSELGDPELLDLNGQINIEGDVQLRIIGKALKWKEENGQERIFWKGLKSDWEVSRDLRHIRGEMIAPGFDFDLNGKRYYGEGCFFKTERTKNVEGLWLEKGSFRMNKMQVNNGPDQSWSVVGLNLGEIMDADLGKVDTSGTLKIAELNFAGKKWGPLSLSLSLKNIESQVAKTILNVYRKIQMQDNPPEGILLQSFLALLPDLLKSRPEFVLENMNIQTEHGNFKGLWKFVIGGEEANNISNPQKILHSIASKANFMIPKVLLREFLVSQYSKQPANTSPLNPEELMLSASSKADETITKQLQRGILIEKGNHYLVEAELYQGLLKINGKMMDLPFFA